MSQKNKATRFELSTKVKYKNNDGFTFEIVEFISWDKVSVKFDSGYSGLFRASCIKGGTIKDRLSPSVEGWGIYDSNKPTRSVINGRDTRCPFYSKWKSMIERCYGRKDRIKNRSYIGCSICEEWRYFSNFKKWMEKQEWEGKQLDKDIIRVGNKIYSPDTCVFVDGKINSLLLENTNGNSDLPLGVTKVRAKYVAKCRDKNNKSKYLGAHDTPKKQGLLTANTNQDWFVRWHLRKIKG